MFRGCKTTGIALIRFHVNQLQSPAPARSMPAVRLVVNRELGTSRDDCPLRLKFQLRPDLGGSRSSQVGLHAGYRSLALLINLFIEFADRRRNSRRRPAPPPPI